MAQQQEITVRRAKPGDADRIATFVNDAWRGQQKVDGMAVIERFGSVGFLLAERDDALIGMLGWQAENLVVGLTDLLIGSASKRVAVSPRRDLANMFLFGVAYAVGSLSCTLPIFLVVVGSGLASTGVLASLVQFFGYALGMGMVVLVVTVGTAILHQAAFRWMQRLTPYVHRLSAMFLIGTGLYLIYYWAS